MSGYYGSKEILSGKKMFPKTLLTELSEKPENIKDQHATVKNLF